MSSWRIEFFSLSGDIICRVDKRENLIDVKSVLFRKYNEVKFVINPCDVIVSFDEIPDYTIFDNIYNITVLYKLLEPSSHVEIQYLGKTIGIVNVRNDDGSLYYCNMIDKIINFIEEHNINAVCGYYVYQINGITTNSIITAITHININDDTTEYNVLNID